MPQNLRNDPKAKGRPTNGRTASSLTKWIRYFGCPPPALELPPLGVEGALGALGAEPWNDPAAEGAEEKVERDADAPLP
jgi:hypothetical protein